MTVHSADPLSHAFPEAFRDARADVEAARRAEDGFFLSAERRTQAHTALVAAQEAFRDLTGAALMDELHQLLGVHTGHLTVTVSTRATERAVIESVADGRRCWEPADLASDGVTHAVNEFSDAWAGCLTTVTLMR